MRACQETYHSMGRINEFLRKEKSRFEVPFERVWRGREWGSCSPSPPPSLSLLSMCLTDSTYHLDLDLPFPVSHAIANHR